MLKKLPWKSRALRESFRKREEAMDPLKKKFRGGDVPKLRPVLPERGGGAASRRRQKTHARSLPPKNRITSEREGGLFDLEGVIGWRRSPGSPLPRVQVKRESTLLTEKVRAGGVTRRN